LAYLEFVLDEVSRLAAIAAVTGNAHPFRFPWQS
jgi:hypothetical protein